MDKDTLLDILAFLSGAEGVCAYMFYYQEFPFEIAIVFFNSDICIINLPFQVYKNQF